MRAQRNLSIVLSLLMALSAGTLFLLADERFVLKSVDKKNVSTSSPSSPSPSFPVSSTISSRLQKQGCLGEHITAVSNQDSSEGRPQIAWLMSFPNSGTSYTLRVVAGASNTSVATNYGKEALPSGDEGLPGGKPFSSSAVFPERDWEGPFVLDLNYNNAQLPKNYVLTKTHCGGRCVHCPPQKYMMHADDFAEYCGTGTGCLWEGSTLNHSSSTAQQKSKRCKWQPTKYPIDEVTRAIHLFRNPYDNIVSRFHLSRKHAAVENANNNNTMKNYPISPQGFRDWCEDVEEAYPAAWMFNSSSEFASLPCLGEWLKYIQWHNLATRLLQRLQIPVYILYYEDYYQPNWNATISSLLHFLDLPFVQLPLPFQPSSQTHDQSTYFTAEEMLSASRLVRRYASKFTLQYISHYLPATSLEHNA